MSASNHSSSPGSYGSAAGAVVAHATRRCLETLFPARCGLCQRSLPWRRDALGLCDGCRARLGRPGPRCRACGTPRVGPGALRCGPCQTKPRPWSRLFFAWDYGPEARFAVAELKFRGRTDLARPLALALDHAIRGAAPEGLAPELVVVPVPMVFGRRLARGFNQADLLARELAELRGLARAPLLYRRDWWRGPIAHLGRTQRRRRRQPFRARSPARGASVLLVDDIITTGSTLGAAAHCLRRAGAREVLAAVVTRTPRFDESP